MNLEKQIQISLRLLAEGITFTNQTQIDQILDKIQAQGLGGLSPQERKTLQFSATGPQELPELKRTGLHLLSWFKNPQKSRFVDKPDGTSVQGVKSSNSDLALAILYYKPEGHVEMSFNIEIWERLKKMDDVEDEEIRVGIQQWASRELALRVEPQHIYSVHYNRK